MESRLEFDLVQQSPMIHFQYDEKGAALRATDVKPRLDRFLIEEYKKKNAGEGVPKDWVQAGQPGALKYRMRIAAPAEKPSVNVPVKGLYFGNMGDRNRDKMMIFYKKPLQLEIICFVEALRNYIERKINLFFFLNNFGTRQGKGFGSFIIAKSEGEAEKLLAAFYDKKTIYRMVYPADITAENILFDVNEIYKILKSGINYKGVYIKSYLTLYFLKKGIQGEKRWMKNVGIAPIVVTKGRMPAGGVSKPRYIRAVLGTGEIQNWLSANEKHKTYKITNKNGKETDAREDIEITSKEIARMPSPIVFKIIRNELFIFPNEPQEEIYDKKFTFINSTKRKNSSSAKSQGELCVPQKDEFCMDDLMKGFKEYFNREKGKYSKMPKGKSENPDDGKPFFFREKIMLEEVKRPEEEKS